MELGQDQRSAVGPESRSLVGDRWSSLESYRSPSREHLSCARNERAPGGKKGVARAAIFFSLLSASLFLPAFPPRYAANWK